MRILLTGLVSVHWGRVEFGNIGNYYIVETTVRELHRVFPNAEIVTTFQMTKEFCELENVSVLPLSIYYDWSGNEIQTAMRELGIAQIFEKTGILFDTTPYISEVRKCDLVIDFSGEMWGDHAEPVGKNRFLNNLLKMRVAQLLGKKTALLAGSQGPFEKCKEIEFAKEVFKNFDIIANREAASADLLKKNGFDVKNVKNFTDPAFLFDPYTDERMKDIYIANGIDRPDIRRIGFILCGFNMAIGPYDKEPRSDEEFITFAKLIEYILENIDAEVFLMSHQNGFEIAPEFKLIQGRDYPYAKQLYDVVTKRAIVDNQRLKLFDRPLLPKETKAVIKQFDMLVTGRIHAFVAGTSQYVPTVIITRGHGGLSHRNLGFAMSVGMEGYISDPADAADMILKVDTCWRNRNEIKRELQYRIPQVKEIARQCFDSLREFDS